MENETSIAVVAGVVASVASFLALIFIPGLPFKIIALILTQLAGSAYLFYIFRDFSAHCNFLLISYSGFGMLLFLTHMGWLTVSIGDKAIFAAHIITFLVPVVFCMLAAVLMKETERNYFVEFFRGQCVIMAVSLVLFYIYWFGRFNLDRSLTGRSIRMVPFATLASFIEQLIYGRISHSEFFRYLAFCIVVYIPFGYLLGALGHRMHIIAKILVALMFPALMELIQFIFVLNTCDIDDILLGFVGGMIGLCVYSFLDFLSLWLIGAPLSGEEG